MRIAPESPKGVERRERNKIKTTPHRRGRKTKEEMKK